MDFIRGCGPRNAKIVIVGECWGLHEEEEFLRQTIKTSCVPFVGASGWLLNEMLSRSGINRTECYLTNVINQRPLNNDFGIYYLDKKKTQPSPLLLAAIDFLKKDIAEIQPNVIIALGGEALKALTGKHGIENWRGSIIQTPLGKVIPSHHPAAINREYIKRSIAELDLRKARRESFYKELKEEEYSFKLNPTFVDVLDILSFININKWKISFDIETSGEHTRCLGIAWGRTKAICIPIIKAGKNYWSIEEEIEILKRLDVIFKDKEIKKSAQNFPFDATILANDFGFEINNLWMDTMVSHHCCYSELPKGLDFLASIYTDIPYYCNDLDWKNDEKVFIYNCWDCVATYQVAEALEKEMKELGVADYYKNHCEPLMLSLTVAGNRGILVDIAIREQERIKCETKQKEIDNKILSLTGIELNPDSPKAVMSYLYTTLKLKPVLKRKTRVPTADEDALVTLKYKYPAYKELIDLILEHRGLTKMLGTFLLAELNEFNRYTTTYSACGTVTGRINSRKTIFKKGGDIQAFIRGETRRIFIAPNGKIFIKADLSQCEIRAVAWFAGISFLIENFQKTDFDIHRWTASLFNGIPIQDVTKLQRQEAKGIVHGLSFERGAKSISMMNDIPLDKVQKAIATYKGIFPELARWQQHIRDELYRCRRLKTPFGRQRIFMDRLSDETFRSALATLPQATTGDLINQTFYAEYPFDCFPIIQAHDEIVLEVPDYPEVIAKCVRIIKEKCEQPIWIKPVPVPLKIPVEISIGYNWFKMEKYKND